MLNRRQMLRSTGLGALALIPMATSGCASWLAQFMANPVATIGSIVNGVQTVVSIAQNVWNEIFPLIPPADQQQAQTDWTNGLMSVNLAIQAAQDAAEAAKDATDSKWASAVAALGNAIDAVQGIIKTWQSLLAKKNLKLSKPPVHEADLSDAIAKMHVRLNRAVPQKPQS